MKKPSATPPDNDWLSGFHIDVCSCSFILLLFVRSMLRHWTLEHLITLLFLWQTQTAATFAIAAALVGAVAVLHQTAAGGRREEEGRKRRADALWAVLPLDLMELSDYATNCAKLHAGLLEQSTALHIIHPGLEFPPLPEGLVDRLAELIEAADGHANPLITLARRLQIQHARARDIQKRAANQRGSILLRVNVIDGVIDAVDIHARCASLFPYARGDTAVPVAAITSEDVRKALWTMSIYFQDMDELESRSNVARMG